MTGRPRWSILLALSLAIGCGDDPAGPEPEVAPASVAIEPSHARLGLFASVDLEWVARDAQGERLTARNVEWTSSDARVVHLEALTGETYNVARVTSQVPGTATITVAWQGTTATAEIEVLQLSSLRLAVPDTLRALGDTARVAVVEALDDRGRPIPAIYFDWTSNDESVLVVDSTGLVTAVGNGSSSVRVALLGGSEATDVVVTVAQLATSVSSVMVADTLRALGDTLRLGTEAFDANGNPVPAELLSWSSADESVVAVAGPALVTAVGHGTAEVFAASGGDTASAAVTVAQRAVGARVVPAADTLWALRDSLRLGVERFDANGHALPEADVRVAWSSSDESVATVDPGGLVMAVGEGTVEITARLVEAAFVGTASILVLFFGERDVLEALYHSTGGPRWRHRENWLTEAPLDTWHGVETDEEGRVISLELPANGLVSQLPPELGSLTQLRRLRLWANEVQGRIPPELGRLENLEVLELGINSLEGSIPRELGNLRNLEVLDLEWNPLTGEIPPEISSLNDLRSLNLSHTELGGSIPAELGNLHNLEVLNLRRAGLTGGIPQELGSLGSLIHLDASENRLAGVIPADLSRLTNLLHLNLGRNSLGGFIPTELASLPELQLLDLSSNRGLTGGIPPELARLSSLQNLSLAGTDLGGAIPPELGRMRELRVLNLADSRLTGSIPPELGELTNLVHLLLFEAPWAEEPARLTGQIPPELGNLANLETLSLWGNRLTGPIPPELGSLANLEWLVLQDNDLSDGLPPQLGQLVNLKHLRLFDNGLEGPIPAEITDLALDDFWWHDTALCAPSDPTFRRWIASIADNRPGDFCVPEARRILTALHDSTGGQEWTNASNWVSGEPVANWYGVESDARGRVVGLDLRGNGLSGTIPAEIAELLDLRRLELGDNRLSGEILGNLVDLEDLEVLNLSGNRFSGRIPDRLGGLAGLTTLDLADNQFTDTIPGELGNLLELETLRLSRNPFGGPLPGSLTQLGNLVEFHWDATSLCAPEAQWFTQWMAAIPNLAAGDSCSSPLRVTIAGAHVNQAAQSFEGGVPLIAGRPGLVRVFASAGRANEYRPRARAMFFVDGRQVHRSDMELESPHGIPEVPDQSEPDQAFRARIPGAVLAPGVEMVVELDPDSVVPRSAESVVRLPAEGRLTLDVREMPRFKLTLVPVVTRNDPDSSTVSWANALGPEVYPLSYALPVGRMEVTIREPFVTASPPADRGDWTELLRDIQLVRAMDGTAGYYYGVSTRARRYGIAGAAFQSDFFWFRPVSAGIMDAEVMTHELGHNMSLGHAPCGLGFGSGDPAYPYEQGEIGAWGYDARSDSLVSPLTYDLMSYCDPSWISDYNFSKALDYRLAKEGRPPLPAANVAVANPAKKLLLWGGVSPDGVLTLEPAFVLDMPAALPSQSGRYRLEGYGAGGAGKFLLDFAMDEIAHGGASFLFALPFEEDWHDSLRQIVLTGPEGMVELNEASREPVALVLDRETGRLRSVLRSEDAAVAMTAVAADAAGADFTGADTRLLVSYGLPGRTPN